MLNKLSINQNLIVSTLPYIQQKNTAKTKIAQLLIVNHTVYTASVYKEPNFSRLQRCDCDI